MLQSHKTISKLCEPIYCINDIMLEKSCFALNIKRPKNMLLSQIQGDFDIKPGIVDKDAGKYSYLSFVDAITQTIDGKVHALATLPINKQSWSKANIGFVGHTQLLRDKFLQNSIMMMGCEYMFVALYTDHLAIKDISNKIIKKDIVEFLITLYHRLNTIDTNIAVLGLNPHSGDDGIIGCEDIKITQAINEANKILSKDIFVGPIVPDVAFIKTNRQKYKLFVAMYHDQGLSPLKALYFDEVINISLSETIKRTSVGHGTAFDIAYKKENNLSSKSYINCIKYLVNS